MSQVLAILSIFVAAQGYLLVVLIMSAPKQRPLARWLLALFVFIQATSIFKHYFAYSGIPLPVYSAYISHLSLAYGPLIYLYVRALVSPDFHLKWYHAAHFLPVLLSIIITEIFLPVSLETTTAYPALSVPISTTIIVYEIIDYLWKIIYLVPTLYLLPDYERFIRGNFSSINRITLSWLYRLITLFLIVYVVLTLGKILYAFGVIASVEINRVIELLSRIFFFYFIAVSGYRQQSVFDSSSNSGQKSDAESADEADMPLERTFSPKYQHSSLEREACETIWQQLNGYMRDKKPYLDNNLKLEQLAKGVGVSGNQLSQTINSVSGQSFYDFVNGYRVEKARELIESPDYAHLSMLDVAMESGFANNATFHRHFKKRFSTTPLRYKKSIITKN